MPITLLLTTGAAFAAFPAFFIHTLCMLSFWILCILSDIIINSSVVPQGYCPQISQHSKGWTWCSFSSYAIIPWGFHVVVCHHWCHNLCIYLHSHQNGSHSAPSLGCCDWYSFIIFTGHPTFHVDSHLQSGNAHKCDIWVHCLLYASRPSHCQCHLQDNCIHYNQWCP